MGGDQTVGFRRKCPGCLRFFIICRSCDRGHRYCSSRCKSVGRLGTFKRSSSHYRITGTGRKNHSERQKRYRKNRRLKFSETQHSSEIPRKTLDLLAVTRPFGHEHPAPFRVLPLSDLVCVCCCRQVSWLINSC